ncbi:GntR family transcriptional regulator [Halomonas piscis]|uniref:GntR family transcriptional regulator n=1 Tax=Halomonas piscis TaxID=3031727 RepID=A0ABY9YZA3_9GAMM|nr:GntR family transcriptional regulator [Halomonas piscis]WNK19776.1 GntR family transcriptional regulator [Halomonas piscis]
MNMESSAGASRIILPTLAEEAYQTLHRLIVRGQLSPGVLLQEQALCTQLGISRTPLREALKRLAGEGLVLMPRNRRSRVAPIDVQELEHLFEVEAGLESMAAGLAASRITNTELQRLEMLQERLEKLHVQGDRAGYFELNQRIHSLIVNAAKNPVLEETHQSLLGRLERARYLALNRLGRWQESTNEHREILNALKNRDSTLSQYLLAEHVRHTGEAIASINRHSP